MIEDYISKCFHTDRSNQVDEIIPFSIADTNLNYDSADTSSTNPDLHPFEDADSSDQHSSNEDIPPEIQNALPKLSATLQSTSRVEILPGTETPIPTSVVEDEGPANNGSNNATLLSIQETAMSTRGKY